MTKELKIETRRGTLLDGVLFGTGDKADTVKSSGIAASRGSDTVLICITGIHGNFYSNPFYYNIGNTLTAHGIDFIYAQTNDAFGTAWSEKSIVILNHKLLTYVEVIVKSVIINVDDA